MQSCPCTLHEDIRGWSDTAPTARTSKMDGDVWLAAPPVEGPPDTH